MRMKAREWVTNTEGEQVNTDKLMADCKVLEADIEQLLKASASQGGQSIAHVRAKAAESLTAVKARVADLQDAALANTRAAGRATDEYVHANPWQVMAVCAVAGVALGYGLAWAVESRS
jgi:ElaB/YqjD/DUF883 family membrane-anchored ribosome-binding protein